MRESKNLWLTSKEAHLYLGLGKEKGRTQTQTRDDLVMVGFTAEIQ